MDVAPCIRCVNEFCEFRVSLTAFLRMFAMYMAVYQVFIRLLIRCAKEFCVFRVSVTAYLCVVAMYMAAYLVFI